jgi:hypothetical protein
MAGSMTGSTTGRRRMPAASSVGPFDGVPWFAADGELVLVEEPFTWPAAHHGHNGNGGHHGNGGEHGHDHVRRLHCDVSPATLCCSPEARVRWVTPPSSRRPGGAFDGIDVLRRSSCDPSQVRSRRDGWQLASSEDPSWHWDLSAGLDAVTPSLVAPADGLNEPISSRQAQAQRDLPADTCREGGSLRRQRDASCMTPRGRLTRAGRD